LPAGVSGHFEVTFEAEITPVVTKNVIFNVTVPSWTPVSDTIYIAGTFNYWDPGPGQLGTDDLDHDLPLTANGGNQWQIALPFFAGDNIEYKYTRGSWESVEKGAAGEEIPNRILIVPNDDHIQNDFVANWRDITSSIFARAENNISQNYYLSQNYPNPFNSETTIRYGLLKGSVVNIRIYDTIGQLVKSFNQGFQSQGIYQLIWDGKDRLGQQVPSGIYFYNIIADGFWDMKKMILMK